MPPRPVGRGGRDGVGRKKTRWTAKPSRHRPPKTAKDAGGDIEEHAMSTTDEISGTGNTCSV